MGHLNTLNTTRKCCYIDPDTGRSCELFAAYSITYSDDPANHSDACIPHVGELLGDSPRHSIVAINAKGEDDSEHCRLN